MVKLNSSMRPKAGALGQEELSTITITITIH